MNARIDSASRPVAKASNPQAGPPVLPASSSTSSRIPMAFLLLYIILAYVRPHEFHPALQGIPLLPVVFVLTVLSWLIVGRKRFDVPLATAGAALVVCTGLSVAASGWIGGALPTAVGFAPVVLFGLMIACCADTTGRIRAVMFTLLVIACVLAEHGIEQSVTGVGWSGALVSQDTRITYLGFMNDPNDLARLFVTCLPFALYFTFRRGPIWQRVVGVLSIPLLMYGIVLANSRGAYFGVMVMVAIMAIRRYGTVKGILLGAIPMLALIALAPSRMDELSADEESAAGRVEAWYAGILMFRENPFFGVGKGGFIDHHDLTAHNSFVQAFAELGFSGYYFWFAILATAAYALNDLLRPSGQRAGPQAQGDDLALSRALLGACVGLLVTSFFLSRAYELTMYLMLGLVFAHHLNVSCGGRDLVAVTVGRFAGRILAWAIASIVGIYLITKLLL